MGKYGASFQQVCPRVGDGRITIVLANDIAININYITITANQVGFRMGLGISRLNGKTLWSRPVVGIVTGNILAF